MFLVAWVFSLGEIVTFSNLVSVRSSHLTHVRPYCVFVTPKPGPREVKNESNQVCFNQWEASISRDNQVYVDNLDSSHLLFLKPHSTPTLFLFSWHKWPFSEIITRTVPFPAEDRLIKIRIRELISYWQRFELRKFFWKRLKMPKMRVKDGLKYSNSTW